MKMSASIIMSAYNASATIGKSLESLRKQTIQSEIIVIDDGSTDNTVEIVSQFDGVQIIKQHHQGPAAARNLGAARANGEIFVFVDADMTFASDFVEKLIQPIIKDNVIGTFTKDEFVANWQNPWARCWNYEYTGANSKRRLPPQSPDTSPVFRAITKQAFDSVGGFDRGGYDDDWSLSRKLSQQAIAAPGATVWHKNPGSVREVFDHAVWVSTRQYKAGIMGKLVAFVRANPLASIIMGIYKAIKANNTRYIPFKVIYNAGISWGLLKQMPWLVVLLALVVRLPLLDGSFWLDEAAQALESARPLALQFDIIPDFQPPLFHILVHLLTYVDHANWWLRLASLIPGLLTVWLTYKIGRLEFNQTVALLAAIFVATSQFHLFYSQELRPYALAAFFAAWSMYELFLYFKSKRSHFWFVTIINLLGLYTMYLYPFFIMAQTAMVMFTQPKALKKYIGATAIISLLFIPWLPTFFKQLATGTGWLTSLPGWSTAVSPALIKMLPLTVVKLVYGRIIIDPLFKDAVLLLLFSLIVGVSLKKFIKSPIHNNILIWASLPIIIAFLVSLRIPVLDPKRVIYVLPGIYLIIALGLTRLRHGLWLAALLISLNSLNLLQYWTQPINQREPWQAAIKEITTETEAGTILYMFAFPEPFAPWRWYADPDLPTLALVPQNETDTTLHSKLSLFTGYDTVILFDYLMDLTDPERRLHQWLLTHGYRETDIQDYPNIGFIREFSRNTDYAYSYP
jgi:glycosyltransferase involved in cell wall biosynthesis